MVFSSALTALTLALPLASVNGWFRIMILLQEVCSFLAVSLALRTKRTLCPDGVNTAVNPACCSLFPVVQDLTDNLFENECGDSVSPRGVLHSICDFDIRTLGSWCSSSGIPRRHWTLSHFGVRTNNFYPLHILIQRFSEVEALTAPLSFSIRQS